MKFTTPTSPQFTKNLFFYSDVYRFGFNGKDKESEFNSGAYDFGARIHDARLGRWMSVDPLYMKYIGYSPLSFCVNKPISCFDYDGRDIIVINDENAVNGLGHAAVLIGDDKNGWYLYSKNGTYGSSGSSGDSNKHPEIGVHFKSLSDFAEQNKDEKGNAKYTRGFRIETSQDVDEKMKTAATKQCEAKYDVTGITSGSCIDVCSDALEAAGLNGGNETYTDGKGIDHTTQSAVPNTRYEKIVSKNKAKGNDVSKSIRPKHKVYNDDLRKIEIVPEKRDKTSKEIQVPNINN